MLLAICKTSEHKLQMTHKGSYMSDQVLLHLLKELGKKDKIQGLPSILSLFRNELNFNNTEHEF